MAKVTLYKNNGQETGVMELPDALFAVATKPALVHEAVVAQEANSRVKYAHVKDKSEVRGGGKKPWKQKGTGRARHGSRRSPIWVGGGVTFGPSDNRNFSVKINKKARKKAMAMLLSDKVSENWFVAVDDYGMNEGKTSDMARMRAALPGADASALIVTSKAEQNVVRAAKNLDKTQTISASSLNVRDLAKFQYVIASQAAIEQMKETYL